VDQHWRGFGCHGSQHLDGFGPLENCSSLEDYHGRQRPQSVAPVFVQEPQHAAENLGATRRKRKKRGGEEEEEEEEEREEED
jgi:hypothetical protein